MSNTYPLVGYSNLAINDSQSHPRQNAMAFPRWLLPLSLGLLMLTGIVEMAFISSMVYWLHRFAGGEYTVATPTMAGTTFTLHGKPKHFLLNQGHTSNGAAGTAFVGVGLGGILVLWLRARALRRGEYRGFTKAIYHAWLVLAVLSALLSIAALVYTYLLTYQHWGQTINIVDASLLNNQPYPNQVAYPNQAWTPENWFKAVLKLPLAEKSDRKNIWNHLYIMRAWRWNLIPLVVFGVIFAVVALLDAREKRRFMGSRRAVTKGRV
nr:hypothetical protein B0A51_14937 [Rachicladosporium sp. CCFEE 5018]